MRLSLVSLLLFLSAIAAGMGLVASNRPADESGLAGFWRDLRQDIPIRAGMTVEDVKLYAKKTNEDVEARQEKWTGDFAPPIFAIPELHLYVFALENEDGSSLSYWVNGRNQFWMDMAIHDGKIQNIYITPGNASVICWPPRLYDGSGKHVGFTANYSEYFKLLKHVR